ncbi:cytochrome P450 2G1-like [Rhinophrynus dorsalis]
MDITALGMLFIALLSCLYIYSTWNTMYKKRNLPPGPTPYPVIGNLLSIKKGELVKSLMKLWEKHGSVFTFYFGSQPVIMLCGYDALKEAFVDQAEDFGGRGHISSLNRISQGYGLAFSNGERWRQMHNFTIKTLKDFGMGKKSIEVKIQEEAHYLVEEFRKSKGIPIEPHKCIMDAVSNVLFSILFGNRFEYSDETFSKLLFNVDQLCRVMCSTWGQLENLLPKLMVLIPGPHQKSVTLVQELISFMYERVKANEETLDPSSSRDMIDSFLIKMQQEKDNPNTEFNMKNILMTLYSLLLGGTETVTTTLKHGLLLLVKYSEIQDKIHQEIDQVIGRNRAPNMNDRNNMPYTEAVINEIQRFADVLPLNGPHKVTRDTQFRGYAIPKDTEIYAPLCTVHRDPKYFFCPDKFNPDRFLDEQGRFKKNNAMVPFSAGKRSCPGESLARMELFLFITNILQNFTLTSPTHFTDEDVAPKMKGFVTFPVNYQVSFVPR